MRNAQNTFAVNARRQVLSKTSKTYISSEPPTAKPSYVSSASQADERVRYASWTSARHLSEKRTYQRHTRTTQIGLLSVTLVQKTDTRQKIQRRIPAVPARRSLAAMACFKVKTSSEQRRQERSSAKVALSDELDEVR